MMKRILLMLVAVFPLAATAAGGGAHGPYWEQPAVNLDNKASLQRGAQLFVNYCMGCHSARYHRWMHVADDLDIPEKVVEDKLIWLTDAEGKKVQAGSLMNIAMGEEYGARIFGKAPPDLTLTARSRGPAWIYNYLRTFYLDEKSPNGVNNAVLQNPAMPHVLWPLQGWQRPVFEENASGEGKHIVDFEQVTEGSMSAVEYDRAMNDLVNFMVYLGEPARMYRTTVGAWVLLFLVVLLVIAYAMKKEYWKDVH
ncbi:MAG: cytochrome c1 [Halofilum sp. (in: g-proteobacteria)]|nr:cytochrome c1 [Halofilum sp. (in: g-proteobacteria)]